MHTRGTGALSAAASESLRRGKSLPQLLLALLLSLSCGCTTHSYYRDDGAKITVKKFVGIPYIEKEERTISRPAQ